MPARRPAPPATPAAPPDLFGADAPPSPRVEVPVGPRPLADRLRPRELEEVVGQDHLVGPAGSLSGMLARGSLASLILWGPPGVGKTTIARLLAERAGLVFVSLSAVFSGVADLKRAFEEARQRRRAGQGTLLFVDEIHRFNRAQQDGFLPVVEDGTVTLVGATTENPSFALNGALLSRCQVLVLKRLDDAALELLLARAAAEAGRGLPLDETARATPAGHGGWRRALPAEPGRAIAGPARRAAASLDAAGLGELLAKRAALYDKDREEHYNLISALHKSLRGSDPDAALYWFARMIQGGEDPRYIARRLTRFAAEDVGMADPRALPLAIAAWETYERLGSPEGELALAQLVVHLGTAPKSNAVYVAWGEAQRAAKETGSLMPPKHILNAPTKLMQGLGYGAGYAYDHDTDGAFSGQDYFPEGMRRRAFYRPSDRGAEAAIGERLERWAAIRAERASGVTGLVKPSLVPVLLVAAGGAIGSVLRYLVSLLALEAFGTGFPWGTLAVNILGSAAIGVCGGIGLGGQSAAAAGDRACWAASPPSAPSAWRPGCCGSGPGGSAWSMWRRAWGWGWRPSGPASCWRGGWSEAGVVRARGGFPCGRGAATIAPGNGGMIHAFDARHLAAGGGARLRSGGAGGAVPVRPACRWGW